MNHPLRWSAMLVAAFSTVVEWYDFTLYLYFATVLGRVFFGAGRNSLAEVLAAFAVAYLMRPLGAAVFGHIGDRFGRRPTLLASMALMTAAMFATALLPGYAQIGPLAGGLLLALRCLMGFSVGGEYTGIVVYLLEGAAPRHRGLLVSLAAAASELGGLMALGLCALVVNGLDGAALTRWGWRIPFLFGGFLAAGVWLARSAIPETPEFLARQASGEVKRNPLGQTWRHQRKGILRSFAISALGSITYYVGITYVPAFLSAVGLRQESQALGLSLVAAVAVIAVTPFVGLAADLWGRKPVLLALCGGSLLLPVAMFSQLAGGSQAQILVASVVLACLAGGVSAVGAVATAEQFPPEERLCGLAFGATGATAIFGGLAPYVAQTLVARTGHAAVPGVMIAVVALVVLPVLIFMPETRPRI